MSRVGIKVCGLRRAEDVGVCVESGVDFVGFIFVPGSPRFVTPAEAKRLESGSAERVGVFADQPLEEVLRMADEARLDRLQLHGSESPEYAERVGAERVIKTFWPDALRFRREGDADLAVHMKRYVDAAACFLFDAGNGGGGHGVSLAFERLKNVRVPRPFFIAGGLGMENAGEAVRILKPFAVDLNSALETAPGVKDAKKIRETVRSLKA